jgi:hypothetical protein
MNGLMTTPVASLRPSRGNALRPGKAGSAAFPALSLARMDLCL